MGGSAGKFATNIAKTAAKGATTAVLSYGIPIFGGLIASFINGLYAEGTLKVEAINDKVKEIAPDDAKFKLISTPEQLKTMIQQYPEQAQKAGLTIEKVDKAVAQMAKGGQVKTKKPRTAKQIEATKKLVALNKEKRMKKYGTGCSSLASSKKTAPVAPAGSRTLSKIEGARVASAVMYSQGHTKSDKGRSIRKPEAIGTSNFDRDVIKMKRPQ